MKSSHGRVLLKVTLYLKWHSSMSVFHVFKIVQMVPNRGATHHIYILPSLGLLIICINQHSTKIELIVDRAVIAIWTFNVEYNATLGWTLQINVWDFYEHFYCQVYGINNLIQNWVLKFNLLSFFKFTCSKSIMETPEKFSKSIQT